MKKIVAAGLAAVMFVLIFSSCAVVVRENERNPLSSGGAYIYIRENTEKITRDEPLTFDGSEKLEIALAKNEAEGAQFVFRREKSDTSNLSVTVSDLVCEENGAKLTSADMTVYRQRYHLVDKVFDTQVLGVGYYPDALLDLSTADNSVSVSAGENQGYWITVRADGSTPAGIYKGTVRVAFDGGMIEIPFECEVWNFAISETNHLGTSFGMSVLNTEYYEKLLNDYRICGTFLPYGGALASADYQQHIRNEKITDAIWWYRPSYNASTGTVSFSNSEKALYSQMKNDGWLEKIHVNFRLDEPTSEQYEMIGNLARAVKSEMPGLKVLITSTTGIPASLADCVDWCIKPDAAAKSEISEQHEKGLEVWWYTCNFPVHPLPSMHINDYQLSARITGIMADDYGIDGFLYWDTTNDGKYEPDANGNYSYTYTRNAFEDVYVCDEWPAGDGFLVYQGRLRDGEVNANTLVPSLRLEAFRDGMEDYEYLYLLREKYAATAEKLGVSVDANDLLRVFYDNLYKSSSEYYSDGTRLTQTRKQLAAAILSEDDFLVSIVSKEEPFDSSFRKVTVFADTDADFFVDGEKMNRTGEKTFELNIRVPNVEKYTLTVSSSDGRTEKSFLIFPERTEASLSVVSQPTEGHIDGESPRFRISSADFSDGQNIWENFNVLSVTLKNTSDKPLEGLLFDVSYPLRRSTFEIPTVAAGETVTVEFPLSAVDAHRRVSSLTFRFDDESSADFSVISVSALKKSNR